MIIEALKYLLFLFQGILHVIGGVIHFFEVKQLGFQHQNTHHEQGYGPK